MTSRSRSVLFALSLASVVLVASTMRSPVVGLSGVLDRVVLDLNLSALVAGSLTTIPVLAFAVCTPFAAFMIRRTGYKFSITMTLLGIALGIAVRSIGSTPTVVLGTALIGLSITLGNVTMPVMIRDRFPIQRRAMATALYTTSLNLGAMLMLLAVVPLADAWGWRWALGVWVVHAAIALIMWLVTVGGAGAFHIARSQQANSSSAGPAGAVAGTEDGQDSGATKTTPITTVKSGAEAMVGDDPNDPGFRKDLKFRLTVMTLAFGFQSLCYYSVTAWLPQILMANANMAPDGAAAAASIFQMTATVGAFGIPILAKFVKYKHLGIGLGTGWLIFIMGMLTSPELWILWLISAGIAQGGAFTLVMFLMVQLAQDEHEAARFSALVQGIGYSLAAVGPSLLGYLYDLSGNWNTPLYLILGSVLTLSVALYLTTRDSAHIKYR